MAVITAVTPQKKDKTRCNLEVDGSFCCGMKLETAVKHCLKAGTEITEEQLSAIQLESERQTALEKAMTHISSSMKTEREVRLFLKRKGCLADVCEYVIGKMKDYALIDDKLYAKTYAQAMCKKKGARLIALELRQKGADEEAIEYALSGLDGEEESAKRILEKYLRGKELDRETLSRGYRYLLSKGFEYETARSALASLRDDED